jgi:hypothetical protein
MNYEQSEWHAFTPGQVDTIKKNDSIVCVKENFLSQDEFETLQKILLEHKDWPERGELSDMYGLHWDEVPNETLTIKQQIRDILEDKMRGVIGDFKLDFMILQHSNQPWYTHVDWRWSEDKIPYMTAVIPIAEIDKNGQLIDPTDWKDTHTIVFKQSNYGAEEDAKQMGIEGSKGNLLRVRKCYTDPGAVNFTGSYSITYDDYEKYLSHLKYEEIFGLEIDTVVKWKPRMMSFHPQARYHCASNFHAEGLSKKYSIVLFTLHDT